MKIETSVVSNYEASKSKSSQESDIKFADELKSSENEQKNVKEEQAVKTKPEEIKLEEIKPEEKDSATIKKEALSEKNDIEIVKKEPISEKYNSKNPNKIDNALGDLNNIVDKLRQTDEKLSQGLNKRNIFADKKSIKDENGDKLIDNNLNVPDNKDKLPKMNLNTAFSGDGQPFSSFMNNQNSDSQFNNDKLSNNLKDLAEEAAILSTMSENIAIANRNELLKQETEKEVDNTTTIINENGIKKVDLEKNLTTDVIVKYDTVVMNKADVEVFANLVTKGEVDMNNLAPEAAEKSIAVSKTLADLLAKSMKDNSPVRIDFDNDISVIIKISRNGKITADFLPSSQVAETYLKENLPLLKQRFDEEHIDYDSLNQRQKNKNQENNKRKERNNE